MIFICASDYSQAQIELRSEPLDLVFESVDLEFRTEDIKGETQDLEITETDTEITIELSGDILFDFDKWDIREEAEPTLGNVAEVINRYGDSKVIVEGHTDSKGSDSYNQELSQKRADSVKSWLVKFGEVDEARVTTEGRGESEPVAPNSDSDGSDNPEGRQKNRRVEITVEK
ncbi:MAG: OmpA family protein [Deltaproteobacteria bacterium]